MKGWITPATEFFARTPVLEYIECPTIQDVLANEKLTDLIPNLGYVVGVPEEEITNWLIQQGCVQVGMLADLVQFRGRREALTAAWRKCIEITGQYRGLDFEIVE
jgi:hypothetical protein